MMTKLIWIFLQSDYSLRTHQERKLGIKHYCSVCGSGPFWTKKDLRHHETVRPPPLPAPSSLLPPPPLLPAPSLLLPSGTEARYKYYCSVCNSGPFWTKKDLRHHETVGFYGLLQCPGCEPVFGVNQPRERTPLLR